jgi:hypothetical protein
VSLICTLIGHKPMRYGSQGRISDPYHDGIGRSHRHVDAKCERCGAMFNVGSVIDPVTSKHKEPSNEQ